MSTNLLALPRMMKLSLQRWLKRHAPQTLFSRSMVILITPLVLTLGIGLFVFFDRHWSTTTTSLTNSLAGEIALVTTTWEQEPDSANKQEFLRRANQKLNLRIKTVATGQAAVPMSKLKLPGINQALEKALNEKLRYPFLIRTHAEGDTEWIVITVQAQDGLLKFTVPPKRLFSTTTYVFLLFMIGSGLILSIVAVIFMRNQIRPVHKLAIVAEQFGKGIDVPRFKPKGAKEVRQAAQAFLDMRDRIKRQIRQRTDMLSGVSHDLRTPLTRLKLQLAMLPHSNDIEAMQGDILAMEKMIKAYLDFAKDETTERSLRCNIVDILQQAVQDAARRGFMVAGDQEQDAIVMTLRPQAMARVFANLLENARLYAHHAWITVNKLSRSIEIIVDDDGPGIPENRREDVFKPFHRIDDARNQDIEGTGLGLTISRDIVQSHGGTITLDQAPQGGLRVIIWLPL